MFYEKHKNKYFRSEMKAIGFYIANGTKPIVPMMLKLHKILLNSFWKKEFMLLDFSFQYYQKERQELEFGFRQNMN